MPVRVSWNVSAEDWTHEVRECARQHVRHLGIKQGLHLFAQRMGITERRARSFYVGEPVKLLASEWHAVGDARMALRRDRAAALRRELQEIEGELHAADLAGAGALVGAAR
jgi:hypothetical protein